MLTLKTLTIALVCATAQAGYSMSSMLTTALDRGRGSDVYRQCPGRGRQGLDEDVLLYWYFIDVGVAAHDRIPQQAHEFLRVVPAYDSRLPPAVLPAVFLVHAREEIKSSGRRRQHTPSSLYRLSNRQSDEISTPIAFGARRLSMVGLGAVGSDARDARLARQSGNVL